MQQSLSWCPVNDVAATLSDLLISENTRHFIYHVENPARQAWPAKINTLADALDVPITNIVPFHEWIGLARQFPGSLDTDNPAGKLVDFLEENYIRMSCGGLILDTSNTREHSITLRNQKLVSEGLVKKYIGKWKEMGFLHK